MAALLNKLALNLLRHEKTSKVGIKNRRLHAGWDKRYLLRVLTKPTLPIKKRLPWGA